ncbi:MAG: HAMP domain-containing sensor histidine kinase [Eubacteriales bacterium]|nr:HAMP domain-containing sensor histidine kinase [Eubacteriales bacterium]
MIKYIKKRLSLKIFLLTTLLLMGIAAATYGFIAAYMPVTYSDTLNRELETQVKKLTEKLTETDFSRGVELLEDFSRTYQADMLLTDDKGSVVYTVSGSSFADDTAQASDSYAETVETDSVQEESCASDMENSTQEAADLSEANDGTWEVTGSLEETDDGTWETVDRGAADLEETETAYGVTQTEDSIFDEVQDTEQKGMGRFPVNFKDRKEEYTLSVIGSTQKVNQAVEALEQVFPLLLMTVFAVSVFASVFYSGYLTRPIVRLSKVSRKMADLDFSVRCQENRPDEIGILSQSLDDLSESLDKTLKELQEANRQLKDDMEKEREQERRRMEFFAAASHELKTPVTILKGQLEGMIQGVGSYKDRDRYLLRAREVVENMEETVQEILTISRMETKGFAISPGQVDLAELIRIQLADLNELFEKKHMHMEINLPDRLFWMADDTMMAKVVRNLLVNAVRYSPENARICVGLQTEGDFAVFRAENSGVWIAQDQLEKIFDAFYRVDTSRNRKSGGSGLGLYIVREILEQHHAQYRMENTASGVQFTFRLPAQDTQTEQQDFSTQNT